MSTRPVSPPPVAHWKFRLGAFFFVAVGATAFLVGGWPPGVGTMLVLLVCLGAGIGLSLAPYILEYEARIRLAEAQVHEHIETQIRRLTQTTEQLGNAISRSQSTEEQAGQALGTMEELTEKLNSQADELAQTLARSHEREISSLKADVERLVHERDDRLAALDQRLDTVTGQLSEHQLATKKTSTTSNKTLEEVKERMIALAVRLDEFTQVARAGVAFATPGGPAVSPATPAIEVAAAPGALPASVPVPASLSAVTSVTVRERSPAPESPPPASARETVATATAHEPAPTSNGAGSGVTAGAAPAPAAISPAAAKPRVRRAPETPAPTHAPSRISNKPQPLDLPLLDLSDARPIVHRDASGGTSTLVATAYIGIGNKLYVRGDGPGLNWEQGVPMQFLAIGKWGWTSPEADEPITCRIYRNDETPMLDENIVIAPGSKAEITPRF